MLAIRDRIFDVSSATFDASLSLDEDAGWRFQWSLEVETVGRAFDGATWHPRLYAETLLLSLPSPDALPGHVVHVPELLNADGAPNFLFYVFEHESAYDVEVAFGPWRGEYIGVTLNGKADVNWDDDYGSALPIRVECPFRFEGINVLDRSEESARSRLAQFYDPDKFVAERARIGFNFRLRPPGGG
jgi:hypothetical protein